MIWGGGAAPRLVVQHQLVLVCSQTGQNGLVDVVTHQDAAGDAAALEQAVDVAYVLLVENGDHQIVAVAVGDIDGKSDVIIEKLRARDRVFILRGGQIDDEKAKDLALLSHKVPRSRIWEKVVLVHDAFHPLPGLFGDVGVSVQDP